MDKWIDINKNPPNNWFNRNVLVYMPKAYCKIDVQTVYANNKGGSCFSVGWNKGEGNFEVTHWMPLPEEPKD